MRDAVAGIACDDKNILVAGITADECHMVDRLHDLAGPACGDSAQTPEMFTAERDPGTALSSFLL